MSNLGAVLTLPWNKRPGVIPPLNTALNFNRDSAVLLGGVNRSFGSRLIVPTPAGSMVPSVRADGPVWERNSSVATDYLSLGQQTFNNNRIALVIRYCLTSASGSACLFTSSNDDATAGALVLWVITGQLRAVVRTTATRITDKARANSTWHTVALRVGYYPWTSSTTGNSSIYMWVDGEACTPFVSVSAQTWNVGEFALGTQSNSLGTNTGPIAFSLAAISWSLASDEELRSLSANPWQLFAP